MPSAGLSFSLPSATQRQPSADSHLRALSPRALSPPGSFLNTPLSPPHSLHVVNVSGVSAAAGRMLPAKLCECLSHVHTSATSAAEQICLACQAAANVGLLDELKCSNLSTTASGSFTSADEADWEAPALAPATAGHDSGFVGASGATDCDGAQRVSSAAKRTQVPAEARDQVAGEAADQAPCGVAVEMLQGCESASGRHTRRQLAGKLHTFKSAPSYGGGDASEFCAGGTLTAWDDGLPASTPTSFPGISVTRKRFFFEEDGGGSERGGNLARGAFSSAESCGSISNDTTPPTMRDPARKKLSFRRFLRKLSSTKRHGEDSDYAPSSRSGQEARKSPTKKPASPPPTDNQSGFVVYPLISAPAIHFNHADQNRIVSSL